jgi:hypothetical protein
VIRLRISVALLRTALVSAALLMASCRESSTREDTNDELAPGATIDLGSAEAQENLVEGFFAPERSGRRNASWSDGSSSRLTFRLKPEPSPYVLAFLAEPYVNILPFSIAVALNGKSLGNAEMKPGWQGYRLPIDPSVLRAGDNKLALNYSRTARPADVEPQSPDVREISVRIDQVQLQPISNRVQLTFHMRDAFSRSAMGEGWAVDENDRFAGIWTVGRRAVVRADLTKSTATSYALSLTAQAQAGIAEQAVHILVNGADLGTLKFQSVRSTRSLTLTAAAVREQNEIAFVFDELKAPSEINPKSSDSRLLGLRVLSLELVPALP